MRWKSSPISPSVGAPEVSGGRATADDTGPLTLLLETIEALSGARTLEAVAEVVRTSARKLSGADGVTFVLRDGAFCHYLDEDAITPLWKGRRFPIETCISGHAITSAQTIVIPDTRADDRVPHEAYDATFVRSLVMTPVRADSPLAAIGAYWDRPRQPTQREIEVLSLVARATATAIETVKLLGNLEAAIARRDALLQELDHRVKNSLAATLSIANQTLSTAESSEDFVARFTGRLMALSRAQDTLADRDWAGATLSETLDRGLRETAEFKAGRLSVEGPCAVLAPETAVSLTVALHELLDNARRHGALGAADGRVALTWSFADDRLALDWVEQGGPPVAAPARQGFGLRMLQLGLPRDLKGESEVIYGSEGLRYHLTAPLTGRITPVGSPA
jgi:two-component sensor histidine kinase